MQSRETILLNREIRKAHPVIVTGALLRKPPDMPVVVPVLRLCTDCGERLPTDKFYRYRHRYNDKISVLLSSRCHACHRARQRNYARAKRDRLLQLEEQSGKTKEQRLSELVEKIKQTIPQTPKECATPGHCKCPGMARCRSCGYTQHDKDHWQDHHLCNTEKKRKQ